MQPKVTMLSANFLLRPKSLKSPNMARTVRRHQKSLSFDRTVSGLMEDSFRESVCDERNGAVFVVATLPKDVDQDYPG